MSSTIITSLCSCGNWQDNKGSDKECSCGKMVYEEGDIFGDVEPEYKALETITLDLNKVIPFLKANSNIENFKPEN